jgi:hypothetical protein
MMSNNGSVQACDGSRYPAAAAWCIDLLPSRVREGKGDKTVGYVNGLLARFTSGRDGAWAPIIERRMQRLGFDEDLADFVSAHVEMKVATMLIVRGHRLGELVINHMPCGSRPDQRAGCHQVLAPYLPSGYMLVVHGTTQLGLPFSEAYQGRA